MVGTASVAAVESQWDMGHSAVAREPCALRVTRIQLPRIKISAICVAIESQDGT
jgi:hypothetical protein